MKLRAEDLVKKYKSRTVVKGVSVNVEQGEIVGLLGTERGRENHVILYDCGID